MIPGALGKLALDFKVDTLKDHFPHYFNPLELYNQLNWEGDLPDYKFFEPKRTTLEEYQEMVQEYKDRKWNFLSVARKYIRGDVEALHQVLIKFFKELAAHFPINPLRNLSIPGIASTIWKTKQLPLLLKEDLKVYYLSRTSDNMFRGAYLGGFVDVYKPHLIGEGYYYDVNSLYPTAMLKPMPVGPPTPLFLTAREFELGEFFGFVKATVLAPNNLYIGLLPIKLEGRLVCPGGVFEGFFFSEELRFLTNWVR